ncbi:MAG: hypothetical protein JOS17DRAFT_787591 [Linnemannia elongata]|nr:MAG: hypothetical protein JOS17DRAFT_787591 [Linnemannia elongata]
MAFDGVTKDDFKAPEGDIGKQISDDFVAGNDLLFTVLSAMGEGRPSVTRSNTQHACDNHKADFGYTGSCAGAGLKAFREILMKFEYQKADKCCRGRYKNQEAIIVYQQSSQLALIGDPVNKNTLISGWRLGAAQYQNVINSCSLTYRSFIDEDLFEQTPFV